MKESARYILQILVFLALILSSGTAGYLLIEDGISVSDAFYTTVTAITPTQFDEVHPLSVPGRYFTVVLVFCGFGAVVAFATQFARLVIQSELEGVGVITRKQMRRRIRRMKNHYIVCGYGEIGGAICAELRDQRLAFVVIAETEQSAAAVNREGYALVIGNPTADASLREAGIDSACGVIAVLPDDANNLFIALAARELNPKIFIIARGEDSAVEDRMLRAGADIVVSPVKLGGRQIAELIKQQAGASSMISTGEATGPSVLGLTLSAYQHASADPTTVARILAEATALSAAGIRRSDGSFESDPPGTAVLNQDDALILITQTTQPADPVHRQSSGRTILLADDHRALRLLFARKLASAGHDVIQAANGSEALQIAITCNPDLIVLDVNMPERSGYEVCSELRRDPGLAKVPVILYSGEATDEFAIRGQAVGADLCVRKTSKSSELLASIESVFARRQQQTAAPGQNEVANTNSTAAATVPESLVAAAAASGFDHSVALDNAGGDPELLQQLIQAILQEAPQLLQRIDSALAAGQATELHLAAHTLKSSCQVVGATAAARSAAALEQAARQDQLGGLETTHQQLQQQVHSMLTGLRQVVSPAPV